MEKRQDINIDLTLARNVLSMTSKAIANLDRCLDETFADVVRAIADCRGNIVVTGIGKAGLIGTKVSA